MIRHTLLCFGTALFLSLPAFGQSSAQAKEILDKTAALLTNDSGIKASFLLSNYTQQKLAGQIQGTLSLKGKRFILETPGTTTWFDGRTQWTYVQSSEEINISIPTREELQTVHPYSFIHLYQKGYNYRLAGTKSYKGKTTYQIILTPQRNKEEEVKQIVLWVNHSNYQPVALEIALRDGTSQRMEMQSYRNGLKFLDSNFSLNTHQYPHAEIIDLR